MILIFVQVFGLSTLRFKKLVFLSFIDAMISILLYQVATKSNAIYISFLVNAVFNFRCKQTLHQGHINRVIHAISAFFPVL